MPLRTVVRCGLNRYQTPLFSFDVKGIYLHCKDCRRDSEVGSKRGAYHLVTWTQLMAIMARATQKSLFGVFDAGEAKDGTWGTVPGGSFVFDEIIASDNGFSRRGGEGEELDGSGLQLPVNKSPDTS